MMTARAAALLAGWGSVLATRAPQHWPWRLRAACALALSLGVIALVATLVWRAQTAQLAQLQREQRSVSAALQEKQAQLQQLVALAAQRASLQAQIGQHQYTLPAQLDGVALLETLALAARTREVELVLARPAPPVLQALYRELPVALKLRGRYHDLGALMADLTNARESIVLGQLVLGSWRDGILELDAQARLLSQLPGQPRPQSPQPRASTNYAAAGLRDPFAAAGPANLAQDDAEVWHGRHALGDVTMLGSIVHQGVREALVQVAGRVYRVGEGQPLGREGGRVWRIEARALQVRERGVVVTLQMREPAHDNQGGNAN